MDALDPSLPLLSNNQIPFNNRTGVLTENAGSPIRNCQVSNMCSIPKNNGSGPTFVRQLPFPPCPGRWAALLVPEGDVFVVRSYAYIYGVTFIGFTEPRR